MENGRLWHLLRRMAKVMRLEKWLFSAGIGFIVGCGVSEPTAEGTPIHLLDSVAIGEGSGMVDPVVAVVDADTDHVAVDFPLRQSGERRIADTLRKGKLIFIEDLGVKDRVPGRHPYDPSIQARADSLNRERQRRHDSIREANGGVSPPRIPR